uniref:RIN4 pathogenic type III effector avirulence factor Avr cleavage site domain-containing protein n=1 Tax=Physcomitrium patens TaxID=3218 RepID=A0A7I4CXE6_PHYPA
MARPHVPKFGNWDANGGNGGAYTAVFDQARTGKGGKPINPNDPAENEALAAQIYGGPLPTQRNNDRPPPRTRPAHVTDAANRPRHERRSSREDLDVRRSNDSASRQPSSDYQGPARKPVGGPGGRAEPPFRRPQPDMDGDGSSHNAERAPANPHANRMNARETGRGAASPAWERRGRNPSGGDEGSVLGSGTLKSRPRPQGGRAEESGKGGALPKFGDWNEKDPNAGDGFTMIFQKLSNEKREGGPVHIPRLNSDHQASHEDSLGKHSQLGVQKTSNANDQPKCCVIL